MSAVRVDTSGGTFGALLAVLFIGLKLTGYIAWPWLWVLAPLWAPFALLCIGLSALAIALLAAKGFK